VIREAVRLPAAVLKQRAAEVDPTDPDVVALADDLVETMYASPGCVGLAANQVGVSRRVFCLDVTGHKKARSCHGLLVLANPVLVLSGAPELAREGCLSVPDLTGNVVRAGHVVVQGYEPGSGRLRTVEADAIEARGLLHEIDHLDGLVFLDRVASAKHDVFARKRYR
jgi:peptide deformylase